MRKWIKQRVRIEIVEDGKVVAVVWGVDKGGEK